MRHYAETVPTDGIADLRVIRSLDPWDRHAIRGPIYLRDFVVSRIFRLAANGPIDPADHQLLERRVIPCRFAVT